MTFSLVARCEHTGMLGVAISSSSPAVAARCAYAKAGVGAVASQNITDPRLGPAMLQALSDGLSVEQALADVVANNEHQDYRQVLAVDAKGQAQVHSGTQALGNWADASAANVASGGNLLHSTDIPQVMVGAFSACQGHLGDRLLASMQAALAAGGEAGPVHSAGMLIVDEVSWPVVDLRCDWTEDCPIAALSAAWQVYKPQIRDYVQRALNPSQAPSYGVPGDD